VEYPVVFDTWHKRGVNATLISYSVLEEKVMKSILGAKRTFPSNFAVAPFCRTLSYRYSEKVVTFVGLPTVLR